jgi:hypothetical protein
MIVNSRTGTPSEKRTHTKVDDHFMLWFSSNDESGGESANNHMKSVMKHIRCKEAAGNGRLDTRFMPKESTFYGNRARSHCYNPRHDRRWFL